MRIRAQGRLVTSVALSCILSGCATVSAVLSEPAAGSDEDGRQPLQIGKLIKKRQIAPVTSIAMADWLNRPEREAEEQPDRVIEALNIKAGSMVVDLGAGTGYFTGRLARQVGPNGRVMAVDVQQGMLDRLRRNLEERDVSNVQLVLGKPGDPLIPPNYADLVLLVDVYHEIQQPEAMMEHVRRGLKPGGRVVVIEYRKEDPSIPLPPVRKMTVAEVRSELEPLGFRFVEAMDFVPTQHIIVFEVAAGR
ncbi:MAG: class I SAM-dependent methyltransferase [Acidobacteria bacterium]|nr:class I SAM-dependent methyltransferase [Acidobacteriota bacterium]